MSKKPKIYSFCSAGCKWPTVHEDDFLKAATYIEKPVDLIREGRNVHYIEMGKQYKIKATKSDIGFNCSITFEYTESNGQGYSYDTFGLITIPITDKYADSFVFKLLEAVHDTDNILYLIYERSGVRFKQGISGVHSGSIPPQFSFKENNIYIVGADAVYEYNSEANYSITPNTVFIKYATSSSGDNMTKTYSGQSYIGTYVGMNESINPADYTWVKFVGDGSVFSFKDVSVSADQFTNDTTYSSFGYKATIPLTGVTAAMIPTVVFGVNEATSGDYAPVVETYEGGIYIYSKVNTAITIPTVVCQEV